MRVAVRGSGMASGCCAHLLAMQGISAAILPAERPPVPALLLSDAALNLLRGVFGRPSLFADRPRIERRIVAWGGEAVAVPHGAVVVSEAELNAALFPTLPLSETGSATAKCFKSGSPIPVRAELVEALPFTSRESTALRQAQGERFKFNARRSNFTIHTATPFPTGDIRSFGQRQAMAAEMRLLHDEDQSACWVEAVETGWLFLIPTRTGLAWLLAVGATVEDLLPQSRHIAPRVAATGRVSSAFETCPRLLTSLTGPDWLACGTAAIAFDPICGDGTAQSIREAIVAAAVIAGLSEGGDREALLTHYDSMLIAAMRRHLQLSAPFYQSGGQGPWWQAQLAALAEGYDWCTNRLATLPEPRFQLRDFRLIPREEMA